MFGGRKTEVAPGAADTIVLDTIRVESADGESLEAKPSLNIANHGEMKIYGRPNQRVYPLDSNIDWVNHRVLHYLTASQTDPNLEVQKADGFLAVNFKL